MDYCRSTSLLLPAMSKKLTRKCCKKLEGVVIILGNAFDQEFKLKFRVTVLVLMQI